MKTFWMTLLFVGLLAGCGIVTGPENSNTEQENMVEIVIYRSSMFIECHNKEYYKVLADGILIDMLCRRERDTISVRDGTKLRAEWVGCADKFMWLDTIAHEGLQWGLTGHYYRKYE